MKRRNQHLDDLLDEVFAEAAEKKKGGDEPELGHAAPTSVASADPVPPQTEVGAQTNIFNEPVQTVEAPKSLGADGVRRAEPAAGVPADAPYYIDRCTSCMQAMYTRDRREDVCETCAVMLRDDRVDKMREMQTRAIGRLVNPFGDE